MAMGRWRLRGGGGGRLGGGNRDREIGRGAMVRGETGKGRGDAEELAKARSGEGEERKEGGLGGEMATGRGRLIRGKWDREMRRGETGNGRGEGQQGGGEGARSGRISQMDMMEWVDVGYRVE